MRTAASVSTRVSVALVRTYFPRSKSSMASTSARAPLTGARGQHSTVMTRALSTAGDETEEPLRCDRQLRDLHAERREGVRHRVRDRGRRADRAALADALETAER